MSLRTHTRVRARTCVHDICTHEFSSPAKGGIPSRGHSRLTRNVAAVTVTFTRDPLAIPAVESKRTPPPAVSEVGRPEIAGRACTRGNPKTKVAYSLGGRSNVCDVRGGERSARGSRCRE